MPKRPQIFQAFDALKGFRELLKEQEEVHVPERILSEDECNELNWKLQQITIGQMLRIVYRKDQAYIQLEGIVTKFNIDAKMIQIAKTKVSLPAIVEIEILSCP